MLIWMLVEWVIEYLDGKSGGGFLVELVMGKIWKERMRKKLKLLGSI
jgi:hypothetical protein